MVRWCLDKAEEYLDSAKRNIDDDLLYPAAEEVFRAVETAFEAMLYSQGVKEIRYPGKDKPFKGRLALQFLIRDYLLQPGKVSQAMFDKYLEVERELHSSGYMYGKPFSKRALLGYLAFAEELFFKAKGL